MVFWQPFRRIAGTNAQAGAKVTDIVTRLNRHTRRNRS